MSEKTIEEQLRESLLREHELKVQNEVLRRSQLHTDENFRNLPETQRLIQTSFDGYFEVSADNGAYLVLNDAYSRLVGYSREALLSMTVAQLDALESEREAAAHLVKIREAGYDRFETCHRHKDGHLISLEANVSYSSLNGGIFFVFVRDISARKLAEKANKETRMQLKLFIGQAPVGIAMLDKNMNYLAASGQWVWDHCGEDKDVRGLNHYLIHPDLPDKWKEVHRLALAGASFENDEDLWVRPDGRVTYIKWVVRPWLNEYGSIGGIIIFAEDLTHGKLLEIEAQQQRCDMEILQRKNIAIQTAAAFAYELNKPLLANEAYSDAGLTRREKEVLALAVAGHSSKEIGIRLSISFRTVEAHRANVMKKTGTANMLELASLLTV